MCYQSAIIHISDTEFGPKNRAEQKKIENQYRNSYKNIMDGFISDVKVEVLDKYNIDPKKIGLIVSGDITDTGDNKEFGKAERWIKYILNELKIPSKQVAIIPGNHDVNWDDCKVAYEAECQKQTQDEEALKEQMRRSPAKLAEFAKFLNKICQKDFEIQSPMIFEEFEQLGVALIGLDTTYPSLWTDEDNYGAIEVEQVQAARRHLKEWLEKNDKLISIAEMHHSLLPDLEKDKGSFLHYAEDIKRWLEKDQCFDVVLCGHEHTSKRSRSIGNDFNVLVTGSFGLCLNELMKRYEEGQRPVTNKYQIILIAPDRRLKFLYRRLNRENATFPAGEWDEDKSEGESFDKVKLRDRETAAEYQQEFEMNIIDIGKPVEIAAKKGNKHWIIGVNINEAAMFPNRAKSVNYKIEPGGAEVNGDPCCNFLANLPIDELGGRSISACIILENGKEIRKEVDIPSVYNPSDYVLSAKYSK